ncbi:MAG: glycosyltransferase family 1 protein [Phycisphaerales bacterium]
MRPRLLVNAKWRTQPRISGVQRYASGLAEAIALRDLDIDFAQPEHAGRLRGMLWEQRTLPRIAAGYDSLLCPANMAPTRLDERTRLLVVLHCLRFHVHPSSYSASFVRWYERMVPRIIERANTVFTVSLAQQAEIEHVYSHAIGKVQVLPPGLDPAFSPFHPRHSQVPAGRYLACLSTPAPAKNLAMLLRAYASCINPLPLVLVGVDDRQADILCPASARGSIHPLGYISDPVQVASILSHADALLAPSKYESFGLPCLESMGCATPVVASDLPAHREVCADAALFVDPDHPDAWASAIEQVTSDPGLRRSLSLAGRERARAYRWSSSAKILEDAVLAPQQAIGR